MVLTRALQSETEIGAALDLYERNRIDRTGRIVEQSTADRAPFHMRDLDNIRRIFAERDEGADRNAWLYSCNPMTVPLI